MAETTWKEEEHQYLTFNLSGEKFGLNILKIREIIEYGGVTHIPMMPPFIKGVINLRGMAVPVIDLSLRLEKKACEISRLTCIVIVDIESEDGNVEVGWMVDSVDEVVEIPPDQVEPSPRFGATIRTDFISGMGKIEGNFVVLLDSNRVLSMEEISMIEGAYEKGKEILKEKH